MAKKEHNLDYFKGLVNKSIKKYVVMSIIGIVLFNIGLALTIAGPILLGVNSGKGASPDGGFVAMIIVGIILMVGPGLAFMSVGTICWISMGVQIKVARNKLKKDNIK